ncbi:hypothetical protein EJB05_33704, partial [Eragrostis curvula]
MVTLRNGESFPKQEPKQEPSDPEPALAPRTVGTQKKATKRASTTAAGNDDTKPPAKLPASASRVRPKKRAAARRDVTLDDTDAFDCGICFRPLKPPIFQCNVGHVLCSPCLKKIENPAKCHVCGTSGGFHRCHAMERVVESIHIPCPNSGSGCVARPAYHEQQRHQKTCTMRSRFRCPGEACGFVGSMDALLDHFAAVHRWPCTTQIREDQYDTCKLSLGNGFNFLRTNLPRATATTTTHFLFLLNSAPHPFGIAVSVLCIESQPHAPMGVGQGPTTSSSFKGMEGELVYHSFLNTHPRKKDDGFIRYHQSSKFRVACTDFSNGLPNADRCFQFVVPNFILADSHNDNIRIEFKFSIGR